MKTRQVRIAVVLAVVGAAAACGAEGEGDLCQAAKDHVNACLGRQAITSAASCDPQRAQEALSLDCSAIGGSGYSPFSNFGGFDFSWDGWFGGLGDSSYGDDTGGVPPGEDTFYDYGFGINCPEGQVPCGGGRAGCCPMAE